MLTSDGGLINVGGLVSVGMEGRERGAVVAEERLARPMEGAEGT